MTTKKQQHAIYMSIFYDRIRKAGLCVTCRRPRDGKSTWRCDSCRIKFNADQNAIYHRKKRGI